MEKYGGNLPPRKVARKAKAKPRADTGDILANVDTKSQRKLVGLKYPSGKQSKAGIVVRRNEKTQQRDDALRGFDRAKGTGTQRRQAADDAAQGYATVRRKRAVRHAVIAAPVLSVLDQTTRPLHAVAGGVDAAITHKPVLRAVKRGIQNKDKTTFSKVLKDAGVPKGVRGPLALVGDVAGDPLSYTAFGTASLARKGATAVAEDAAKGLTVKFAGKEIPGVRTATEHTIGRAAKTVGKTRPARQVKALVRDVNPNMAPEGVSKKMWQDSTSLGRTAKATQGRGRVKAQAHGNALRKAIGTEDQRVADAVESKTVDSLPAHLRPAARAVNAGNRDIKKREIAAGVPGGTVRELHPVHVPAKSTSVADSAKALAAARRARVAAERNHQALTAQYGVARGRAAVMSRSVGGLKAEKRSEAATVVVGSGAHHQAGGLGVQRAADDLVKSAGKVKAARANAAAAEKAHTEALANALVLRQARHLAIKHNARAAVAPKDYISHYTVKSLQEGTPTETAGSVGVRTVKGDKARKVSRQRPLASLRETHPGVYSEDVALGAANRLAKGEHRIAQAKLNQGLARIGKPVKPGDHVELGATKDAGNGLFHQHGSDLTEITEPAAQQKAINKGVTEGQLVVLPREVVANAHHIFGRGQQTTAMKRAYDQAQGTFKFIATQPNPGFHIRNLIGDTQNAYLGQPGHHLPANMVRSGKALRALKRSEEAAQTLGAKAKPMRGSVTIDGKQMSYEQLAQEAAHVGAIRSGFTNTELPELLHGAEAIKKVRGSDTLHRAGRALKRTAQSREDLPRLTTYIEARRNGMTAEQAAQYAAKFHFDYGHLTHFERNTARRVVPFYTFSARNIPLQAKMALSRPGKIANYEKVREEAANATGQGPDWEKNLKPWEARNAPIPFRFHGKMFTASAGLPIADLNEFPTTLNPSKLVDEWFQKSMSLVSPIIKDPIELWANYSAFFRGPIERDTSPLVAAPSFVGRWPEAARKKLGIVQIVDKKSKAGTKIWAWPGKVNYIAHAIPGPQQTVTNLASGHDQAGRGTGSKIISALGVKTAPIDPGTVQINALYDKVGAIQTKLGALSQQGVKGANTTLERVKLNHELTRLEQQIYQLAKARGDGQLPTVGGPRKGRASSARGRGVGTGGSSGARGRGVG